MRKKKKGKSKKEKLNIEVFSGHDTFMPARVKLVSQMAASIAASSCYHKYVVGGGEILDVNRCVEDAIGLYIGVERQLKKITNEK